MKRLISLLMSFMLVFSMIPAFAISAFAEDLNTSGENYTLILTWTGSSELEVDSSSVVSSQRTKMDNKEALILEVSKYAYMIPVNITYGNGDGLTNIRGPLNYYNHSTLTIQLNSATFEAYGGTITMNFTFGKSVTAKNIFNSVAPNGVIKLNVVEEAAEDIELSELLIWALNDTGLECDTDYKLSGNQIGFNVNDIYYYYNFTTSYESTDTSVLNQARTIASKIIKLGNIKVEDTEMVNYLFSITNASALDDPATFANNSFKFCKKLKDCVMGQFTVTFDSRAGDGVMGFTEEGDEISFGFIGRGYLCIKQDKKIYSVIQGKYSQQVNVLYVPDDCSDLKAAETAQKHIKDETGKSITLTKAGYVEDINTDGSFEDICKDCGIKYDNLVKNYYQAKINNIQYYFIIEKSTEKMEGEACQHNNITKYDYVEPSCMLEGNIEYYRCNDCRCYFSDAQCENAITKKATILDRNGQHTLTHHKARKATYFRKGNIEYWECTSCSKCFYDEEGQEEIPNDEQYIYASWKTSEPYYDSDTGIFYTVGKEVTITESQDANCDFKATWVTDSGYTSYLNVPKGAAIFTGKLSNEGSTRLTINSGTVATIIVAEDKSVKYDSTNTIEINGGSVGSIVLGGNENRYAKAVSAEIINNSSCTPNVVAGNNYNKTIDKSVIIQNDLSFVLNGNFNFDGNVDKWPNTTINGSRVVRLHAMDGTFSDSSVVKEVTASPASFPEPTCSNATFIGWSMYENEKSLIDVDVPDNQQYYDLYACYRSNSDTSPQVIKLLVNNGSGYVEAPSYYGASNALKENVYTLSIPTDANINNYGIDVDNGKTQTTLYFADEQEFDNNDSEWSQTVDLMSIDNRNIETYCFRIIRDEGISYGEDPVITVDITGGSYKDASMRIDLDELGTVTVKIPQNVFQGEIDSIYDPWGREVTYDSKDIHFGYGTNEIKYKSIYIGGNCYTIKFVKTSLKELNNLDKVGSSLSESSNSTKVIKIADPEATGLAYLQKSVYDMLTDVNMGKYLLSQWGAYVSNDISVDPYVSYDWGGYNEVEADEIEEGNTYYYQPMLSTYFTDGCTSYYFTSGYARQKFRVEYVKDVDTEAVQKIKDNYANLDALHNTTKNTYFANNSIIKTLVNSTQAGLFPGMEQSDYMYSYNNVDATDALVGDTNLRIASTLGWQYIPADASLFGLTQTQAYYYVDDVYYADVYQDEYNYTYIEGIVTLPEGTRGGYVRSTMEELANTILAEYDVKATVSKVDPQTLCAILNDDGYFEGAERAYVTRDGIMFYSGKSGTSEDEYVGAANFGMDIWEMPNASQLKLYPSETLDYAYMGGLEEYYIQAYQVYSIETRKNSIMVLAAYQDVLPIHDDSTEACNERLYEYESDVRIAGDNRYETSFDSADKLKETLGIDKFENIIVTNGGNYPDALSGGFLSASYGNAPILLTDTNTIPSIVSYVEGNMKEGGTVFILGDEKSVAGSLDAQLQQRGFTVKRLAGKTRMETNLEVLEAASFSSGGDLIVCDAWNYADSLSASALGKPLLLVEGNQLSEAQKDYLDGREFENIYILGSTKSVSGSYETVLKQYGKVKRLYGATRVETSLAVAEEFYDNSTSVTLAYAWNFPDGLSAGPIANATGSPILLTSSSNEDIAKLNKYVSRHGSIYNGTVLGGDSSDRVTTDAFYRIMNWA